MNVFGIDSIEKKYSQSMAMNGHPGLSNEDIRTLIFGLRNYKKMAIYFANVLSASAEGLLMKKSTGKSERARQVNICREASEMLENEYGGGGRCRQTREEVAARLTDILKYVK